ncbi:hypothetical protein D3C86_2004380 [compost metagenome]
MGVSAKASAATTSSVPPLAANNCVSVMLFITHPVTAAEMGARPMKMNMNRLIARPSKAGGTRC